MTCIVTMPSEAAADLSSVTRDDLYHADYQFATPFIVALDEGEFVAEQLVRLIPARRMVVFGKFRGQPAVAKLFYDQHAGRHYEKEFNGIEVMVNNKIPTPTLLAEGHAEDDRIYYMIFQRIENGRDLETIWQTRESNESVLTLLQAVMIELATQHVLGVMQKDMHMGNFLVDGKIIYTLDAAEIASSGELLPKDVSMKNLALFLSQLGSGVEALQEQLFRHYARARGWLLKPQDRADLMLQINKYNESRWKSFEKKIFRNSTDFMKLRRFTMRGMMRRDHTGEEFNQFMQQPESVFARPDVVMLKNGRSSTVIRVTLDGRELVIKRYNMKNIWHRLRRALRHTRAHQSWRLAQKLNLFYVNTAKPVAYLESNVLGVRGHSYYVTSYVRGHDLKKYLQQDIDGPLEAAAMIKRVTDMLRSLLKLEVTHGDLKATNIMINDHAHPVLIDLDGAREHQTASSLHKAWQQELQRLMRNFDDTPTLRDLFRQSFQKA